MTLRHDWTLEEVKSLYERPLFELIDASRAVHLAHHAPSTIQLCTLVSIKTGGCPEDCGYCSQSSKHRSLKGEPMLKLADVLAAARDAKASGATRLCMGAAWRNPKDGPSFDRVLEMVREVKALGLETCVTLGMLTADQATRLKEAGLDSYNHNLDTSREHYPSIVSTRTFDDRLATLKHVRTAGIRVCSGGIIGMGESLDDRCRLLIELSTLDPHPDSVPINALVPIAGTPLGNLPHTDPLDLVRMVATARIMMPRAKVRLSAGRKELTREAQLFCMYAGANSIFYGEKLLTTANAEANSDDLLLKSAGLNGEAPGVSDH